MHIFIYIYIVDLFIVDQKDGEKISRSRRA